MPEPTAAPVDAGNPAGTAAPNAGTQDSTPAPTPAPAPTSTPNDTPTPAPAPAPAPPPVDDWATERATVANGDEKILARLSRYSTRKDALNALIAAQNRISSGELRSPLPENPTPEELKAWRKENGLPATVDDYKIKTPDGVDEAQVKEFLTTAHELNMTPAQVEKVIAWKAQADQAQAERIAELDETTKAQATEQLRQDWGSEYKLNVNLINGFLDTAPAGVKDHILSSRLPDGTPLANNPEVLRWLANTAREINPVATVVPGHGVNAAQAVQSEINNLKSLMGDRNSKYWKGPEAEGLQKRYRELATVQEKIK